MGSEPVSSSHRRVWSVTYTKDHDKGNVTDGQDAELADRLEAHRARLRAVAYHTLGSPSEADAAVQEAWLRLSRSDSSNIENLGGWLTTVVARVCLDMLQSRREESVGIHLPESAVNDSGGIDPDTGSAARRLDRSRATGNSARAAAR